MKEDAWFWVFVAVVVCVCAVCATGVRIANALSAPHECYISPEAPATKKPSKLT